MYSGTLGFNKDHEIVNSVLESLNPMTSKTNQGLSILEILHNNIFKDSWDN